ncbi:sigma-54-dependent Fis family transcriptional regulator [Pseudosulfitobacter sp. RP-4]
MRHHDLNTLQSREYHFQLERHRDRLLSGDNVTDSTIRDVVADSWRRCKNEGVDPYMSEAPECGLSGGLSLSETRLRGIMLKALASVGNYLEETRSVLIGTDRLGQLFFVEGDEALSDKLAANRVSVGANWDELQIGTNAIGTALKTQRSVLIHGQEHFCAAGKNWSCAADVVRDPVDHSILGVVDLTGPADAMALRAPALISAVVERIESELEKLDLMDRLRLIDHFHDRPAGGGGLLLVDRHGMLVRRNAWHGLDQAHLVQGDFVAGLRGLAPDSWTLDLTHDALRDGEIEWIHSNDNIIGAAIHVGRQRRSSKAVTLPASLEKIVEAAPSMRDLAQEAAILARSAVPVLITGETGVGKEVLASAIHQSGDRAGASFVAINCSAIPNDLIGVELFGYVEGAFTGARRGGMPGRIEDASGGTLLLDEIGDMPLEMQTYLLRFLETGAISRLGESKSRKLDVRVIAATHRPLEDAVQDGSFRADLFYRLNVAQLHIPALRERRSDILPLARRILAQIETGDAKPLLDKTNEEHLLSHDYPGNIRELKSILQRFSLGLPIQKPGNLGSAEAQGNAGLTMAQIERNAIMVAMKHHQGSVDKVAAELDIPRSTLYRRLAQYRNDHN